jgi:tellurite resistance protein TehA-like permease
MPIPVDRERTKAQKQQRFLSPRVTPNLFGIALGVAGLAQAWQAAVPVLGAAQAIPDALYILGAALWVIWHAASGPARRS